MIYFAKKTLNWFIKLFSNKQTYKSVRVEELPNILSSKTIYVVGEGEHVWFVAMTCPCGCEETLYMNTQKESRPSWDFMVDYNSNLISLYPSVWRKVGCKSHFFLREGSIIWCD